VNLEGRLKLKLSSIATISTLATRKLEFYLLKIFVPLSFYSHISSPIGQTVYEQSIMTQNKKMWCPTMIEIRKNSNLRVANVDIVAIEESFNFNLPSKFTRVF
jgi:hypothetical protein